MNIIRGNKIPVSFISFHTKEQIINNIFRSFSCFKNVWVKSGFGQKDKIYI